VSWDYQQPDFYKFSEDSIFLAKHAIQQINGDLKVLDVCSGCGVVGLEIIRGSKFNLLVDFLEIQDDFRSYFEANKKYLKANNANYILGDYSNVNLPEKYDLIVSNPPYFTQNEFRLSPNRLKNNCRFYLNGDLDDLLSFYKRHLGPGGMGLLLCRQGEDILKKYHSVFKFNIISKDHNTDLVEVFPLNVE